MVDFSLAGAPKVRWSSYLFLDPLSLLLGLSQLHFQNLHLGAADQRGQCDVLYPDSGGHVLTPAVDTNGRRR